MSRESITVKFVAEAGFSPEVVNIFARTYVAAATLRELMAAREAARLARKEAREVAKLAA